MTISSRPPKGGTQREFWPDAWPAIKQSLRPRTFYANRHRYPENWKELALALKAAADWTCQECGKACRRPDEAWDGDQRRRLTIAHTYPADHDPSAPVVNVMALCVVCHLRFDQERKHAPSGKMTYGWVQLALF